MIQTGPWGCRKTGLFYCWNETLYGTDASLLTNNIKAALLVFSKYFKILLLGSSKNKFHAPLERMEHGNVFPVELESYVRLLPTLRQACHNESLRRNGRLMTPCTCCKRIGESHHSRFTMYVLRCMLHAWSAFLICIRSKRRASSERCRKQCAGEPPTAAMWTYCRPVTETYFGISTYAHLPLDVWLSGVLVAPSRDAYNTAPFHVAMAAHDTAIVQLNITYIRFRAHVRRTCATQRRHS